MGTLHSVARTTAKQSDRPDRLRWYYSRTSYQNAGYRVAALADVVSRMLRIELNRFTAPQERRRPDRECRNICVCQWLVIELESVPSSGHRSSEIERWRYFIVIWRASTTTGLGLPTRFFYDGRNMFRNCYDWTRA